MARMRRIDLPGVTQHVVQRGHDRRPCFFAPDDYDAYLAILSESLQKYGAQLHAYCLMTNHTHLLMTPTTPGALSAVLQHSSGRFVRLINRRYGRTGTLWESRFKACIVDSDRYALTCHRYIELNPVRAGVVATPAAYAWSSYSANALSQPKTYLTPHPSVLALGVTPTSRSAAYRALFADEISESELGLIRDALNHELAYGSERFKDRIETMTRRRLRPGKPGRPAERH